MIKERLKAKLYAFLLLGAFAAPGILAAQNATNANEAPTTSREQQQVHRMSVPEEFTTHIYAESEQARARAQQIIELYELLENGGTIEEVSEYVSDDYIQHSPTIPNGPQPLAMLFAASTAQYPVAIDVHRIAVVGDFAMSHVNFRNLDTDDPRDLGIAAVDMYLWGEDGKIVEHWDTLQEVPTYSANTNTMFLQIYKGNE